MRRIKLRRSIFIYFVLLITGTSVSFGSFEVTNSYFKLAEYKIIVPQDANPNEEYAASQFQKFIYKATGIKLSISREAARYLGTGNNIYIGKTKLFLKHLPIKADSLKNDGIFIKSVGSELIIGGHNSRGTLNAVYHYLEHFLGFRWWTPTEETIPKVKEIIIENVNLLYIPPFEYRNHYIYNTRDPFFAATLHENGDDQPLSEEQGSKLTILGFVHTFHKILPPDKYFMLHPEWFSDAENSNKPSSSRSAKPGPSKYQLCLSNIDMYEEFKASTIRWLRRNRNTALISISQNDSPNFCSCLNCEFIIKKEGSISGLVIHFVNKLAADIEKIYPDLKFETLAYGKTVEPPLYVRPRHNVIIRVAPNELDHGYAINSKVNKRYSEILKQWGTISKTSYYWGYNTDFTNLILPYPSFHKTGSDLLWLAENGYDGIFIQDNKYSSGFGYFLDLHAWVIGHLLWNPYLNQRSLVEEFMVNYYGPGGEFLLQYIDLIHSSFERSGSTLFVLNTSTDSFITSAVLVEAIALFDKALAVTQSDNEFYSRIKKEKLAFDYLLLNLRSKPKIALDIFGKDIADSESYLSSITSFFNTLEALRIEKIDRTFSNLELENRLLFAGSSINITSKSLTIEDSRAKLHNKGKDAGFTFDNYADDNTAAVIYGDTDAWAIQFSLIDYNTWYSKSAEVDVLVYLKVNSNDRSTSFANTIKVGIYDTKKKKNLKVIELNPKDVESDKYIQLKIPNVILSGSEYIWFSKGKNNGHLELLVDRVELVRL